MEAAGSLAQPFATCVTSDKSPSFSEKDILATKIRVYNKIMHVMFLTIVSAQ